MKINTSNLVGAALDYAVAIADGRNYWRMDVTPTRWTQDVFTPSSDWNQGGPIIDRERIGVEPWGTNAAWMSQTYNEAGIVLQRQYGPTPLIAAMRCYVASNLGDAVEIPEELT